jgi:hypothetical protein
MHEAMRANDGIGRAGRQTESAADAVGFIDNRNLAFGVGDWGSVGVPPEQISQACDREAPSWRTLVYADRVIEYRLGIRATPGVAALCALRARQTILYLVDQLFSLSLLTVGRCSRKAGESKTDQTQQCSGTDCHDHH